MRPSKDSTVRKVVVSLLAAVVVLIPLSIVLNRLSFSAENLNIAEAFSFGRATEPASAAATSTSGEADFINLASEEVDSSLSLQDSLADQNSTVSIGNETVAPQAYADESPRDSSRPDSSPGVEVPSPLTSVNDAKVDDHLGSSSSSSYQAPSTHQDRSEAKQQRVFQPASLPHYAFVKFSAYRQSLRTFFVMGITSHVARAFDKGKIVHTCEWHPASGNKTIVEAVPDHIYWKSDENSGTYSSITVNCTFSQDVGADRTGGLLVLRISTGYDRWDRNLPVVATEELPGEVDVVLTPPENLPFKYAFCGAPMFGSVRADWVLQWMTYHHYLAQGSAHFFFYNVGGLAEADRPKFQRFADAGKLSITDVLEPNLVADYPTWYHHQVLLINDCLHRSRFMAQRVFFIDYDEFVQIPAPDTLSKFMARHEKEPWVSFGSMYANTKDCRSTRPGEVQDPLERMLWRRPDPECRQRSPTKTSIDPLLCIGPLGRRKYVANPRQTFAAGVHWVTIPENGLNLVTNEAHVLHYRSAPTPKTKLCANNITLSNSKNSKERALLDAGWIRDESTSKIYSEAKLFAV